MKKFTITLLILILFSTAGCQKEKKNPSQENISIVLSNIFQEITEEEYREFQQCEDTKQIPAWLDERFKNYMTEEAYQLVLQTALYKLPLSACKDHKSLTFNKITIEENEDYYSFSGQLTIGNSKNTILIEGSAQTNAAGKVSYLQIYNIADILPTYEKS